MYIILPDANRAYNSYTTIFPVYMYGYAATTTIVAIIPKIALQSIHSRWINYNVMGLCADSINKNITTSDQTLPPYSIEYAYHSSNFCVY